ncbi:UPF0149 family protein [Aestuariibacter sp. AA17]|uniref:UPF0149 family protein n=1 Tax=Fluctibacter corallii TaxID=2984329 RepID=A0ABT3ACS2_9ALTE|nr:UPF0149 family protein [Aestuariibacter sp. AA17]MCV2886430.1 UPF0149 family protein [Aestuariibacter sp. AA17]
MNEAEALNELERLCEGELKGIIEDAYFVRGLIFGVSSAPEIPMPEQWLVWALKARGQLASTEQADTLSHVLMSLLQFQLQHMRDETIVLPPHCDYAEDLHAPACQFLAGLLSAHAQLEGVWQHAWQCKAKKQPDDLPEMKRDLTHCLKMFSTFANVPLAKQQAQRVGNDGLIEKLPVIFQSLPQAMTKYVALSGDLVSYLPNQFETFVQPAHE